METNPLFDSADAPAAKKQRAADRVYAKLKRFGDLPDDAVVDEHTAAVILNMSYWTLRRTNPVPQRRLSERRVGRRVGDLRNLIRESVA
jgi:hypothetical protein